MRPWRGCGFQISDFGFRILKQSLNLLLVVLFVLASVNNLGAGELKHQYFLLAETGHKPMCVVDVHVNSEHITVVEPDDKRAIKEITSYVKAGENEVIFEAEALPDEGDDYGTIEVNIGSGTYKDGKLEWEGLYVKYSVSRAQLKKEKKDILTASFKFNAD
jgi:hypothetical protein